MNRSLVSLSLFALGAMCACRASQAQETPPPEPSYVLRMGPNAAWKVNVSESKTSLRLTAVPEPGNSAKLSVDINETLDKAGRATGAVNKGVGATGAAIDLTVEVTDTTLSIFAPGEKGESVVGAPIVTFLDLLTLLPRRYDWKRGGAQSFVYVDPSLPGKLATLTVDSPAGSATEMIALDDKNEPEKRVPAHRLNLTLSGAGLNATRTSTSICFGPNGEALKGNMPLTGYSIRAEAAGSAADNKEGDGFITRYPDGIEPQGNARFSRVRAVNSGATVFYEGPANLIRAMVVTDAQLNPVRIEEKESWRRFRAIATPQRVSWEIPGREHDMPLAGEAWFLTHYVLTDVWEQRAPFVTLKTGESTAVTYSTIEYGDLAGAAYRVERRPDATITGPDGKPANLRVWRVSFAPYFSADLWTDGRRLVKLASSAGPVIVRAGWEEAAKLLGAPLRP